MAIKKVVNKTNKTVKKFPEFDNGKSYISVTKGGCDYYELKSRKGKGFDVYNLASGYVHTVGSLGEYILINPDFTTYILNNQDELARFLLGCREFPKVEEIEVGEELAEDEVSVEDVSTAKIYGHLCCGDPHILSKSYSDNTYQWHAVYDTDRFSSVGSSSKKSFKDVLNITCRCYEVYQFDTQEEFFRWSLEKVTGKEFSPVTQTLGGTFKLTCLGMSSSGEVLV